jgi:hypothetical protein
MGFLFGIISTFVLPFIIPLIIGTWLILLGRFGILPLILEFSMKFTHQKEHIIKWVTQMILKIGLVSVFAISFLCWWSLPLGDWIQELATAFIGEKDFDMITLSGSPVWLVLIVEAWLVLLCYFGLRYLLRFWGMLSEQYQRISKYTTIITIFLEIFTSLIVFGGWIYTGIKNWDKFDLVSNFTLVVLSPITNLLTIGMVVMLYISLRKALMIEENIEQAEGVAKNMTLILLSTFILLSIIGGILSIAIHLDRQDFLSVR